MNKIILVFLTLYCTQHQCFSQSVGIGTSNPNQYAKLDIVDSTKGVLIPRMNSLKRNSIPPTKALLVFDTDTNSFWFNDGTKWQELLVSNDKRTLTQLYLSDSF